MNYEIKHTGVGRFREGDVVSGDDFPKERIEVLERRNAIAKTDKKVNVQGLADAPDPNDEVRQVSTGDVVDKPGSDRPVVAHLSRTEQVKTEKVEAPAPPKNTGTRAVGNKEDEGDRSGGKK